MAIFNNLENLADSALVRRVRRGETAAFEAWCAGIEAPLFSYAHRCIGNRAEAEDLTQEALLRVYRAARQGKVKGSPRAYAFSIVHNLSTSLHRRSARFPSAEELQAPSGPPCDHAAARSMLREEIDRALEDLPEDHRSALLLREFGELSYAEIAGTMGVGVNQVKVWLHRARRALSQLLDRDGQYIGRQQDRT